MSERGGVGVAASDPVVRRVLAGATQIFEPGPVLVLGAHPEIWRELAKLGFPVRHGPLPPIDAPLDGDGWRECRQVLFAVYDRAVAEAWSGRIFDLLRKEGADTVLYVEIAAAPPAQRRKQVEDLAFAGGFRKHPAYYQVNDYVGLENEAYPILLPLARVPAAAAGRLGWLAERRPLHMDMSRESGRRSDGHMQRYQIAAQYVRPGDAVLDAGCGMGYGAWMLSRLTLAAAVTGLDESADAIAYAREAFEAPPGTALAFAQGDAQALDGLAPNSVDLISAFEVLEHLAEPDAFLTRCAAALRPGGRLIASVPNRWVDETGRDPNPYHHHVYDWDRIIAEVGRHLVVDRCYAQVAGGGFRLSAAPRGITGFDPRGGTRPEAEWCLVVAMKSPLGAEAVPFDDARLGVSGVPGWRLNSLQAAYRNPWAVLAVAQAGLARPWRLESVPQRLDMAAQVLAEAGTGTGDAAAMLAVLGYELLSANAPEPEVERVAAAIGDWLATAGLRPIDVRWRISLLYLRGRLLQSVGRMDAAAEAYRTCTSIDPLDFAPAIATKTISAHRDLGWIHCLAGRPGEGQEEWRAAVRVAERVVAGGDWIATVGSRAAPDFIGLFELSDVISLATECALLLDTGRRGASPGLLMRRRDGITKDGLIRGFAQQREDLVALCDRLRDRIAAAREILSE